MELASDQEENSRWFFDAKSSLLSKKIVESGYGESQSQYFDYRRVGGLQFPFRIRTEVKQASYTVEEEVQSIELNVTLDGNRFEFDDSWRHIKAGELLPEFELADTLQQGKVWTRESIRVALYSWTFGQLGVGPALLSFPSCSRSILALQIEDFKFSRYRWIPTSNNIAVLQKTD